MAVTVPGPVDVRPGPDEWAATDFGLRVLNGIPIETRLLRESAFVSDGLSSRPCGLPLWCLGLPQTLRTDRPAWTSTHSAPPALFPGNPFDEKDAPNRYGLADFYSQHAWAWKRNPTGSHAMWNPNAHC